MTSTPRPVFLKIPEQFAGLPISLIDASTELGQMAAAIDGGDLLGDEGTDGDAWRFLLLGLQGGDPLAFVQTGLGGWSQIPPEYWTESPPPEPPVTLSPMVNAAGYSTSMEDQPVAIWRSDLDGQVALLQAVADARRRIGAESSDASKEPAVAPETPAPRGKRVSVMRLEKWFRETRCPAFEDKRLPDWKMCWKAASEYFAPDYVTSKYLQDARRQSAPAPWQKRGPRP